MLLRAFREPSNVAQVLRAQWQLRDCDIVPRSVRLRGSAAVENAGYIEIGERVRIEGRTVRVELVTSGDGRLVVGRGTFLNYGVSLSAHQEVNIGEDCLLANYVTIMDNDYHDLLDRSLPGQSGSIFIGDRVWLGIRAVVLKGVTIGSDSVIGAGSVVTRDIPPNCLAVGSPARVVKQLK